MESETKLNLLLGLYVGALYASNLLGGKLMPIGFGDRGLTVAIIMFPFLFLITDIVGEVHGKKKATSFVHVGLISLIVLLVWQLFSISITGAVPNEWYGTFNDAYGTVFSLSVTFTIASILAFFFGQHTDVIVFHTLRKLLGKKNLWLRNNASTTISQFIDSTLWVFIAFSPRLISGAFTPLSLFSIVVIPYWLAKVVFAVIDTPLCYAGVKWLKT